MKNKKIIFSLVLFFFLIIISNICMAKDLDRINKYYITVDPRKDGSLDMTYYFEWEVLDSDSEGPVTWVEIGIPNSNVDMVKAISDNIKSVKYFEDYGDYIRIDFKKPYYKDDVINFSFSFHQECMYSIDGQYGKYEFIPGWFENIEVKEIMVFWNANNVKSASSKDINSDNYYVWKDSLRKGNKLKVNVTYSRYDMSFDTGKSTTYAKTYNNSNNYANLLGPNILFIIVIIIFMLAFILLPTGYSTHRGYGYDYDRPYHHHHHHSSISHSSCASSCACVSSCACACACAGGGRAGCSKKDFYGITIRTKKLNKIIEQSKIK